jgi:hypothetical protein
MLQSLNRGMATYIFKSTFCAGWFRLICVQLLDVSVILKDVLNCRAMEKNSLYSFLKCCVKLLLALRHQIDLILKALSTKELFVYNSSVLLITKI